MEIAWVYYPKFVGRVMALWGGELTPTLTMAVKQQLTPVTAGQVLCQELWSQLILSALQGRNSHHLLPPKKEAHASRMGRSTAVPLGTSHWPLFLAEGLVLFSIP